MSKEIVGLTAYKARDLMQNVVGNVQKDTVEIRKYDVCNSPFKIMQDEIYKAVTEGRFTCTVYTKVDQKLTSDDVIAWTGAVEKLKSMGYDAGFEYFYACRAHGIKFDNDRIRVKINWEDGMKAAFAKDYDASNKKNTKNDFDGDSCTGTTYSPAVTPESYHTLISKNDFDGDNVMKALNDKNVMSVKDVKIPSSKYTVNLGKIAPSNEQIERLNDKIEKSFDKIAVLAKKIDELQKQMKKLESDGMGTARSMDNMPHYNDKVSYDPNYRYPTHYYHNDFNTTGTNYVGRESVITTAYNCEGTNNYTCESTSNCTCDSTGNCTCGNTGNCTCGNIGSGTCKDDEQEEILRYHSIYNKYSD